MSSKAIPKQEKALTADKEKARAIDLALSSIEKQFGKGSIMRLGDGDSLVPEVEAISTGALSLDVALGIGGLPRGRVVEIYGPESSGKTSLSTLVAAYLETLGFAEVAELRAKLI